MRISQNHTVKRNMARALGAGAVLLVLVVLVMVVVISAAETEPTWTPPQIVKGSSTKTVSLNDQMAFFISVENPEEPVDPYIRVVPWYEVEVQDVLGPALRIDDVGLLTYQGQPPLVDHVGNNVKVTVSRMDPADFFAVQIICTVIGPVEVGSLIHNRADVTYYVDEEGNLGLQYNSASVEVAVDYWPVWLPTVLRSYKP